MGPPDDIQWGEVQYREPARLPRPDRDARHAWVACGTPAAGDLPVFLDHRAADAIERHTLSDRSVELGGILLGKECVDPKTGEPFVWVTRSIEARHYENTNASFTYTHESWEEITRERDRRCPDLDIVGWYHTHPDFGIFLSGHDEFLHRHFFSQPLQLAYVVDPVRNERGFFHAREGRLVKLGGFLLIGDRAERAAIAGLANQLEGLPGGGGPTGLPPRLEAELIDMIKRPHTPAVYERPSSSGPLLALLGLALGTILTTILFWLNGVGEELREQSRAVRRLAEAPSRAAATDGQAEVDAKRKVLDALLSEVRVGEPAEALAPRLSRVFDEIDASRRRDARLEVENEALAALVDLRKREAQSLAAELRKETSRADRTTEEARQANLALAELQGGVSGRGVATAPDATAGSWLTAVALAGWIAFLVALLALAQRWLADRREANEMASRGGPTVPVPPREASPLIE